MKTSARTLPGLALVVQVAFAGKRALLTPAQASTVNLEAFHDALLAELTGRLRRLPGDLGLSARHSLCALSSLAIGGDTLFTLACRELGWWQRLLLPQAREDFLAAGGADGPDFSPAEAATARDLLASPQVIEERVVSVSADRHERFQEVNLELVRICDVFVCLLPQETQEGKAGGTLDALELAKRWRRPALELRVGVGAEGQPAVTGQWHWGTPRGGPAETPPGRFTPPALPAPLDRIACGDCGLTDATVYRRTLKEFSSHIADRGQTDFKRAALTIVGTHVLATALALLAIMIHGDTALRWLLGVELSFLCAGLAFHEWLHRAHAAREWAMARLGAEVARSTIPLAGVPLPLRHLFDLPMPDELRPLLRTLNVLHLAGVRSLGRGAWQGRRDHYVRERLQKPKGGQLSYYADKLEDARCWLARARGAFYLGSAGALAATAAKLTLALGLWHTSPAAHGGAAATLGFLAVLLPAVAVAALSLAAAFDLEARVNTHKTMGDFLVEQVRLLESAATESEFATLALQTETRLLGETANWYARRAFTGVA